MDARHQQLGACERIIRGHVDEFAAWLVRADVPGEWPSRHATAPDDDLEPMPAPSPTR